MQTLESNFENLKVMKNLTFSSQDGLKIFYDIYTPDSIESSTIIQIAHGMVEHKERYAWLCGNLASRGYIVAINDHRGHGKSIDSTHKWGEMGGAVSIESKDGFIKAIDDMCALTQILKREFPHRKFVLLGHSMGSLLSRGYLKMYGENLDALVLSGSPANNELLKFGIALAKMLKLLKLESKGKEIINNLSFGGFNKTFAKVDKSAPYSSGHCAWLSRDKAVVRAYIDDKACQFIFSLDSFIALFRGTLWVQSVLDSNSALQDSKKPPVLILSGKSDACGDFGRGVEIIAQNFKNAGFNTTLKLYPEARHEIFNELNKDEILNDLILWLKSYDL